jgi:hypothetical protein
MCFVWISEKTAIILLYSALRAESWQFWFILVFGMSISFCASKLEATTALRVVEMSVFVSMIPEHIHAFVLSKHFCRQVVIAVHERMVIQVPDSNRDGIFKLVDLFSFPSER